MRLRAAALPLIVGVAATTLAPAAHAGDVVTYEVVSNTIPQVNVEYIDGSGRKLLEAVPLPWRLDVPLDDARGPTGRGAQVRVDWRPFKSKNRTVTVRIYDGADLLCQSTLDVGDATCYGNTPHVS
ncbi:MAG: hypothetical protein QOG79_814 [Mycobacterium sp.]|jgi:hypothetical protein|nr:hypothetical protein [Mycobacterium sp.]MDT5188713.1 hypothetical protein [Mycobacterium sp.]MDT5194511.1 hypothetical protein [Mycobacterium sp.]MDT5202056.1 hypothetical protein [Mycobacterium sp.]MDT5266496.1 hypothetical protein [Mycobacterium sp.]